MELKGISKTDSKIKLVIFTKAGHDNITWYSFLKKNKKNNLEKEAQEMIERAKKYFNNNIQLIIAYDNHTKQEILKYKP